MSRVAKIRATISPSGLLSSPTSDVRWENPTRWSIKKYIAIDFSDFPMGDSNGVWSIQEGTY